MTKEKATEHETAGSGEAASGGCPVGGSEERGSASKRPPRRSGRYASQAARRVGSRQGPRTPLPRGTGQLPQAGRPRTRRKAPLCQHVAAARPAAGVGQRRAGDPGGGAKRRRRRAVGRLQDGRAATAGRAEAPPLPADRGPARAVRSAHPPRRHAAAFRRASGQYGADGDTKRIPVARSRRASQPGDRVDRQGRK